MLYYADSAAADFALGADARYYHPDLPGTDWNGEIQPFGLSAVSELFRKMEAAL